MQILYDTQILLDASVENVWESLTNAQHRHEWQSGISKAVLVSGTAGYRGAKTELTLNDSEQHVMEYVHRSRPLERLHTDFELGDSRYQQIIYLTRLEEERTQLTYHCKQSLNSGWRRILNIRPSVPVCVQPDIFESLAHQIRMQALSV